MAAQRRSAWADVARRIAHEIKNPLTPIQLSAERLKRRFGGRVEEADRKVFDQCTETIVRQVGDIRRMVDEFSGFARMPKPMMEDRDLNEVVREAVFLQEVGNPNIRFKLELPDAPVLARVDHRLVTQALTNVVKNATEAIEAAGRLDSEPGQIVVRVTDGEGAAVIDVRGQRQGPAGRGSREAARALHDDAREGDRARPRDRPQDHGGARRLDRAPRCARRRGRQPRCAGAADLSARPRGNGDRARRCRRPKRTWRPYKMAADILVVDDEADIREIVAGILEDEGHVDPHRERQRQRARGDRARGGRACSSSTSGCRGAGSTVCRCSTRCTGSIPTCRS